MEGDVCNGGAHSSRRQALNVQFNAGSNFTGLPAYLGRDGLGHPYHVIKGFAWQGVLITLPSRRDSSPGPPLERSENAIGCLKAVRVFIQQAHLLRVYTSRRRQISKQSTVLSPQISLFHLPARDKQASCNVLPPSLFIDVQEVSTGHSTTVD